MTDVYRCQNMSHITRTDTPDFTCIGCTYMYPSPVDHTQRTKLRELAIFSLRTLLPTQVRATYTLLHLTVTIMQTQQPYEAREQFTSEFGDLVNMITELKEKVTGCLEEVDALCHRFTEATPGTAEERQSVERVREIVADMERRYQEIDTHYGWVLASDRELRDEVLYSYFGKRLDGKVWLKRSIRMLKKTRRILEMSQQRVF